MTVEAIAGAPDGSAHRTVEIVVNRQAVVLPAREVTGLEIKQAAIGLVQSGQISAPVPPIPVSTVSSTAFSEATHAPVPAAIFRPPTAPI